jgi:hypothetical protein
MDRIYPLGAALILALSVLGCASPGPPRAPSLGLPEPVTDLSVKRVGNTVELRFTAPWRSTDKLPLRGTTVTGILCRELDHQPCVTPAGLSKTAVAKPPGSSRNTVTWIDTLPEELNSGKPRLLGYRVEFFSAAERSAGKSDAAYTAAGTPPQAVEDLRPEGSRLGIVLHWIPAPAQEGDVLLERKDLAPKSPKPKSPKAADSPSTTLLASNALNALATKSDAAGTLDASALPDTPYRYTAARRVKVQLGGRSIELQSANSPAVDFTLREIYPPPDPTGLTAAGFDSTSGQASSGRAEFAIDLIWQPIDDSGLLAGLAGYNVYRAATGTGDRLRLNQTPVPLPAFHDITAKPTLGYRYEVTAVDGKGNESNAAAITLFPSQAQ